MKIFTILKNTSKDKKNYFKTKEFENLKINYHTLMQNKNYKPFAIFSPEINILKNENYELIKPKKISIITYASIRKPLLFKNKYTEEYKLIMDKKIKHLLHIAYENKIEVLILGAWGCNVFQNPIDQVAFLFFENINHSFKNYLKKIIFAIKNNCVNESDAARSFAPPRASPSFAELRRASPPQ